MSDLDELRKLSTIPHVYATIDTYGGREDEIATRSPFDVWTLSTDAHKPGWETDGACDGYGLPKATAQAYAALINAVPELLATIDDLTAKLEETRSKLMSTDLAALWYKAGLEKILETDVYLVGSSDDNIAYKQIARYNLALGHLNGTQGIDLEKAIIAAENVKMVEVKQHAD